MKKEGYILENIINKSIEIEIKIKLIEYLKRNKFINEEMYSFVINKLIKV